LGEARGVRCQWLRSLEAFIGEGTTQARRAGRPCPGRALPRPVRARSVRQAIEHVAFCFCPSSSAYRLKIFVNLGMITAQDLLPRRALSFVCGSQAIWGNVQRIVVSQRWQCHKVGSRGKTAPKLCQMKLVGVQTFLGRVQGNLAQL
jgi:hypothetical protein